MIPTTAAAGYWQSTGAYTPWGTFDPNAELAFSFDASAWAAASGTALTLQSFSVLADPRLTVVAQAVLDNEITLRLRKTDPVFAADLGAFIPFTLRMTLSDGQHDDRTFYLLVRER